MTSDNRRDSDHSMFMSKTPHFFKIILEETIRDGKLGIPRKFVRNHGKQLPSSIKLEVPSGAIWQVELTKSDETVWTVLLQKGWKEFTEHYSVAFGHFLVFRYEGNAHFYVLVFDKTASEIEYPYTSADDDDDLSVEISEQISATKKTKEKPGSNLNSEIADDPNSGRIKLGNLDGVLNPARKEVGGITDTRSVNTDVFSCLRNLTATEKVLEK